jgi:succinate-semialdehyde dehydrogenase
MTAKDIVGQSAVPRRRTGRHPVPEGTKVILARADGPGSADVLSKEKMCPVLAVYGYTPLTKP